MKKLEDPGLDHLKMVNSRMMCEECGETGHMGINFPTTYQDVNFIGNSNGFRPNEGFNSGWNKPNFPFDNRQQGGNGQSFNRNESSLKDIARDQLRVNVEIGKKFLANDKFLESIDNMMSNFTVATQNQLNFNKMLETWIAQLTLALPHPNDGDFPGQPATPLKENAKAMITQSGKTSAEPKTKSKRAAPTITDEKEDEAEAEVQAEPRSEKEGVDLGKASPKDANDTHVLPLPGQVKKPVEDEKFNHFMEVIRRMYFHIPLLDATQVPTYAKYLKDILNQKRPLPETGRLLLAEGCNAAILDGPPDKMGDPGIPTISCLIDTQNFDQALCDQLSHDSLVHTSMHLQLVDQSICHPVRIAEDVLVKIRDSFMLVDFVVLEMGVCRQTPLILGRTFLSIPGATIDVAAGIIKLNINGKEETYAFKPKRTEYCNQVRVSVGSMVKHVETPRKKPDAAKYSKPKFMWRVKNATSIAPLSLVAPVN
jgi:hypothetical protein